MRNFVRVIREFRKIGSNKFVKNTFTLVSGNFLAQIIPFLFAPVITRMYTPEQFGVFGVIVSVITILVVIINGRYEMAVILPKMERKAIELCHAGFMLNVILSIIVFVIIIVLKRPMCEYLHLSLDQSNLLYIIPVFTFVMGSYNIMNYWLLRIKKFELLSMGKIIQFVGIVLFTIILGYYGYPQGLIYGYLIAWILYLLVTSYQIHSQGFFSYSFHASRVLYTAKSYRDFPLFNSISALLIVLGQTISTFYIQKNFSAEDTGYFSQCRQYVLAPMSLIVIAISQSFMQDVGQKIRQKVSVLQFVKNLLKISIVLGIFITGLVYLLAPEIFRIFFGEQWVSSGEYLRILIFSYVVQSIVIPFGNIIHLLNKSRHTLIFPVIYFVSLCLFFWKAPQDIESFLIGLTVIECVVYVIYFLVSFGLLKKFEDSLPNSAAFE